MKSTRVYQLLPVVALGLMLINVLSVFFYVPRNVVILGFSFKIFFFHVPLAINGFVAFFVVFLASVAYLRKGDKKWEIIARSSAEVGIIYTSLVLLTGSMWARFAWGTWWTWDTRLTTTLVLWLLYVGYLMLGSSIEEEGKRGRFLAAYGIVAFADVPLVFFSIRWWQSIHPVIFGSLLPSGWKLEGSMKLAFMFSMFTFMVLYFALLQVRVSIASSQEQILELKDEIK